MAGFLPELALLSPRPMYSPYRKGERKSISAPNSANPTFPSSPTLERSNTEVPKATGCYDHSPKPSPAPKTSRLLHSMANAMSSPTGNATPVPTCSSDSNSSSSHSQAPSTPSPALGRTGSIRQRTPLRFFKHGGGAMDPTDPKPKRNKLVKKASTLQPTFVMVGPDTAKAERAAKEAEAAQLGLQMADAVVALESPELLEEDGMQVAVASKTAEDETEVGEEVSKQTKRWSRAPLLPDFDFSSTSTDSDHLFDPMTDEPTILDPDPPEEPREKSSVASDLRQAASQAHTATTPTSTDANEHTYRCSIHAKNSASHLAVERACCEVVTEAGGRIIDSYSFPGGFLFWIPPEVPEPIASCELAARGVRIELEKWTEFALPEFDGLRLNPPSSRFNDEWPAAHGEATRDEVIRSARCESKMVKRVQTWNNALLARQKSKGKRSQDTLKKHIMVEESPTSGKVATGEPKRCLPASRENVISLVGSLETIRLCGHEGSGSIENMSVTPRSVRHLRGNSDNRFTVVSDVADSDEDSGGEEWESMRSELDD